MSYLVILRKPQEIKEEQQEVLGFKTDVKYASNENELKQIVHNTMNELGFTEETPDLQHELQEVIEILEMGADINPYDYVEEDRVNERVSSVVVLRMPKTIKKEKDSSYLNEVFEISIKYASDSNQLTQIVQNTMNKVGFTKETPDLQNELQGMIEIVEQGLDINPYDYV